MLGEFGGLGFLVEGHQWIPGDSFNYEMQATQEQLEVRYLGLVGALRQLVTDPDRCLSAAVYTELTDVEAEVNGWLTYDRSVNKMLVRVGGWLCHVVTQQRVPCRIRGPSPGRTKHCWNLRAVSTQHPKLDVVFTFMICIHGSDVPFLTRGYLQW